ncbi:AAA family ATPase [Streptomyces sp. NPDC048002]|uniref:helix-turn-helix transcriptional regulator n=1 Tax=Streptomyces sp. NPDC048002 TaxID=3154344 RepID=UPI0033FCF932
MEHEGEAGAARDGEVRRLIGREQEWGKLTRLVRRARGGALDAEGPQALLVTGAPGLGKSLLLDSAAEHAAGAGVRVLRCRGSEGESGLSYAGLHQLLRPILTLASLLPVRQRAALLGTFGLDVAYDASASPGGAELPQDPLVAALGVLSLFSEAAAEQPLLIVVDDAHWLDVGTLDVLAFVARRLEGEPVAVLAAARDERLPPQFLREMARLAVEPLDRAASGALLDLQPQAPIGRVRSRILELAAGNPLALVELCRAAARDPESARRSGEQSLPLTDRLEAIFALDLPVLPEATKSLLLVAAAAGTAELSTVEEAAAALSATADDWGAAERAGLVRITDGQIRFRHPLVRSAVYQAASSGERRAAHQALAQVLAGDPDRRAWHHAAAATGVDEPVAQELEASAERAQRRGGYAAAATALERAAQLSPEPGQQAVRLVRAAAMAMYAGHPHWVGDICARALAATDDPALLAEASLRAGWALAVTTRFADSLGFLLPVAQASTEKNPVLALDALATATTPAYNSGERAHRDEVLRIASLVSPQRDETDRMWILAGCDPQGQRARVRRELDGIWGGPVPCPEDGLARDLQLSRLVNAGAAAWVLDETSTAVRLLSAALDHLRRSPTAGANATVAQALAYAQYESGAWTEALATVDEAYRTAAEAGLENVVAAAPVLGATLAALRGEGNAVRVAVRRAVEGVDLTTCLSLQVRMNYALGAAGLADGDFGAAYRHLRATFTPGRSPEPVHYHASLHYLADLAAAAVRAGQIEDARAVLESVRRWAAGGERSPRLETIWHRASALLADPARPDDAEAHFRAALADPAGDQWPFERAQARLDYAEWLRRRRRSIEARPLLAAAGEVFERLGARPWADRALAELRASGVATTPQSARDAVLAELTPQQLQIARLAAEGLTNREIGERVFLSPRTVGFHLYRIFPKLGITARGQLRDVLPPDSAD